MSKDLKTKKSLKFPKTIIKIAAILVACVVAVILAADLIVVLSVNGRVSPRVRRAARLRAKVLFPSPESP